MRNSPDEKSSLAYKYEIITILYADIHIPLDRISAPASRVHSPVPCSRTAVQVKPAPVVPIPVR